MDKPWMLTHVMFYFQQLLMGSRVDGAAGFINVTQSMQNHFMTFYLFRGQG